MTEDQRGMFADELRRLGVVFNKPIDAETAVVYWDLLADLEWRTVQLAMRDCAASMTWFPKPADIRDAEFGVRAREEQERTKRLLAAAPEPVRETITEEEWQARWAALKRVFYNAPQKPHRPLVYPCLCADCTREHRDKPKPLVPPCYCPECKAWEASHAT